MKSHIRITGETLLPRKVAECARKKGSQTWSLLNRIRVPRVVVLFICVIPLCFRQYNPDPNRHSRHLLLLKGDSACYDDQNGDEAPGMNQPNTNTNNNNHGHHHQVRPNENAFVPADEIMHKDEFDQTNLELPREAHEVPRLATLLAQSKQLSEGSEPAETKPISSASFLRAKSQKRTVSTKAKVVQQRTPAQATSQNEPEEEQSMRACIFVRNDNHLLAEWIAYHYTVLPLRHLIVGVDENATDDPNDVLMRWKGTGLKYQIWHPQNYTKWLVYRNENPLDRFRQRQPHFMAQCLQHFHKTGNLGWLALVDTDEYIKLNPLDDELNNKYYRQKKPLDTNLVNETQRFMVGNETLWDRVNMRKSLRERLGLESSTERSQQTSSIKTIPKILDVLEEYSSKYGYMPCHSMSRRRYSAVMDNYTDLAEKLCYPKLSPSVIAALNATKLSTVRFLYHAKADSWNHNEWAKALVDLRRIPITSLGRVVNPHQPLQECKGLYVNDLASFIHTNHYINDLSVFAGRKGDLRKRNDKLWKKMGLLRDGVRCDQIHGWVNELVQTFGVRQARHLLAHTVQ